MKQQSLTAALDHAVEAWPDRTFLRIDGKQVTFAEFDRSTRGLAAGLRDAGVKPGDRVAVLMRNSLACVELWFAANRLGAVWAPINVEFRGLTLQHVHELADPVLTIADDDLAEHLDAIPLSELDRLRAAPITDPVPARFSDTSALLFTSGTTGRSKACVLSHQYFVEQATVLLRDFELTQDDVLYCPFPLFHADATALTTVPALLLGATAAISRRFSASRFWDEIREHERPCSTSWAPRSRSCTRPSAAPTTPTTPSASPGASRCPSGSRTSSSASGCRWSSSTAPSRRTSRSPSRCTSRACPAPAAASPKASRSGSSTPTTTRSPPNTPGEIVIRPQRPSMILDGYLGMPEATVAAFRNLWFHSGDIGRVDEDGNFFFIGRAKDAIRRRGENISAFEVEEGVMLHEEVVEAAAIGVPSELTEEEIKVCVVRTPGSTLTAAALIEHCQARLAKFQVPRYVEFVDALAKTPTGKIAKHELRDAPLNGSTWDREA